PAPEVKWSREHGESLDKAIIEITPSFTTLQVETVDRFDGGKYMVTVENASGSRTAYVNVRVLDTPGAPQNLVFKEVTRDSVSLVWDAPLIDGGSRIRNYIVEKRESNRKAYSTVCASCHKSSWKVGDLEEGKLYFFRILYSQNVMVNAGETFRLAVPMSGHPKPTITWTKDGVGLKQTTRVNVTDSANHTTLTIKDATKEDGGMYSINIANALGSKDATIEVITLDKPGPATGPVKLEDISAESITLSWEPPTYTGGCQISNYVVEKKDTTTVNWLVVSATVARTTLKVSNLKTGAEYQFRIYAENRYGKSFAIDSEPVLAQYPFQEPGPPGTPFVAEIKNTDFKAMLLVKEAIRVDGGQYTLVLSNVAGTKTVPFSVKVLDRPGPSEGPLRIGNVTEEKCSLSWLPPRHDGGASISHYIIQKRETSRLAWTVVSSDCGATMFKVTKLLKGNEYIFRVMAVNKYGVGEPLESTPVIMRNPFVPPGAPQELEITNITRDSMTVCWSRPEATGGSDIAGYIVEKRDRAGVRWTKCNKRRVTDLRFRVTGLTEDHEYEFRLSAENAAGVGQPSPATDYLKACDPTFEPGCPTNVQVLDTTKNTVSLNHNKSQQPQDLH
uniref:Titin n=1 Tax=Gadus morhua TaxID=8049 RepID=A0A8C5BBE3_GADMO